MRKQAHTLPAGTKVGILTVIGSAGVDSRHKTRTRVRCECGREFDIRTSLLEHEKQKACRMCSARANAERRIRNSRHKYYKPGTRVGTMTVVGPAERQGRHFCSRLKCDCGREVVIQERLLPRYRTCGAKCHLPQKGTTCSAGKVDRIYTIYKSMKQRCLNPRSRAYKYYGGRGISICEEWLASFQAFRKWAVGNGYERGLSIDRIDVNGNYEPGNCRWATAEIQARNQRPRRRGIERVGKPVVCVETGEDFKSASAASRKYGLSVNTISSAIKRNGLVMGKMHFKYAEG